MPSTIRSHSPSDILVTGTTGQVGSAILRLYPGALAPTRSELDLTSESSIRAYIRAHQPRWIVNPAAYTAVDKAESEPALAHAINADAPRILGEEAARIGASVIHFSTDYVFDGTLPRPYTEQDTTGPTSVYGQTKLAGEQALAATGAPHLIFRTSWVYAPTGKNFLLTILRLARERAASGQPLNIVADQRGAPTAAADLAALTAHILTSNPNLDDPALTTLGGVYHATGAGETTWHGFAQEIVRQARTLSPATPLADPQPIPTSAFPTPARRPANSRLDCSKLTRTLAFTFPAWQHSLAQALSAIPPQ